VITSEVIVFIISLCDYEFIPNSQGKNIMLKSHDSSTTKAINYNQSLYLLLATLFFGRAFANNIAITEATDLLISATTFFCFVSLELKRLGSSQRWLFLYVGLTFGIGLCCALPFFLYHRSQILDRQAGKQQTIDS
jgi:Terpene cyclase DEP1